VEAAYHVKAVVSYQSSVVSKITGWPRFSSTQIVM
jgi:hypothetical protein